MNALPLALSLTGSFTKVGAIAGFAALLGIALLSLLAFSQAREIKRLREWAGRAPERAAEMEQRVSTEAAARLQRAGGSPATPGAAGVVGARVVPRKTPLVSAPVSTAVNATVAAGKIGAQPDPAAADPGQPVVASPVTASDANPAATGPAPTGSGAGSAVQPSAAQVEGGAASTVQPGSSQASPPVSSPPSVPVSGVERSNANGARSSEAIPATDRDQLDATPPHDDEQSAAAPATAAARAAIPVPRSPLPPSPSAPTPPGVPASTVAGAAAAVPVASAGPSVQTPQSAGSRPPAPAQAARPIASRAVANQPAPAEAKGGKPDARKPASVRGPVGGQARGGAVSGASAARMPGVPTGSGPKYFKQERSTGRTTLLILGGAVLGVAVIVLAVSALKGGSKPSPTATQSSTPSTVAHTTTLAPASNPSELNVAVVNGTSTNGLAHHLADDLQQSGYKRAEASSAVPPGTHATTVVQYASGHRADGQAVAKALDVTRVKPMESAIASLVGHTTVVVVAGADQAAQLGGGGAQSTGEPSAASGEAATGAGGATSSTGVSGEGSGVGGATEGTAGSVQ